MSLREGQPEQSAAMSKDPDDTGTARGLLSKPRVVPVSNALTTKLTSVSSLDANK